MPCHMKFNTFVEKLTSRKASSSSLGAFCRQGIFFCRTYSGSRTKTRTPQ